MLLSRAAVASAFCRRLRITKNITNPATAPITTKATMTPTIIFHEPDTSSVVVELDLIVVIDIFVDGR